MRSHLSRKTPTLLIFAPLVVALLLAMAMAFSAGIGTARADAAPAADDGAAARAAAGRPNRAKTKKPPRRRGGNVRRAWPGGSAGRPDTALGRWLARQVGGVTPPRSNSGTKLRAFSAAASAAPQPATGSPSKESVPFIPADTPQKLALVRSFDIPKDDPAYERLLNLSWTYDSALAAIAFIAVKERAQAERLLDQLSAVQRVDGSIDFAFNTFTGASEPMFRSGTVAWLGLAALTYREEYKSTRYDKVIRGAAKWLYSQRADDTGLLRGGPDVKWQSTQHNQVAYFFLQRWATRASVSVAAAAVSPVLECVRDIPGGTFEAVFGYSNPNPYVVSLALGASNRFTPAAFDGKQPTLFQPGRQVAAFRVPFKGAEQIVWSLNRKTSTANAKSAKCKEDPVPATSSEPSQAAYAAAAAGIASGLLKHTLRDATHFIQGFEDEVRPLDVQALGGLFLLDRSKADPTAKALAETVLGYASTVFAISGLSVETSDDPASFNMTYSAKGPFLGFKPYADRGSPDVLWTEGSAEMRIALGAASAISTKALTASLDSLLAVTLEHGEGPLGVNRTVTGNPFNEYHVWPTSAAGSWMLLGTGKTTAFSTK